MIPAFLFSRPRAVALLAFLALSTLGCSGALDGARLAIGAGAKLYNAAEPRISKAYEADEASCLRRLVEKAAAQACVLDVQASWKDLRAVVEVFYASLNAAEAALALAESAEATGQPLNLDGLAAAVANLIKAMADFKAIVAPAPASSSPPLTSPAPATPVSPKAPVAPGSGS